jgi:hypothetical protein
MGGAGNAQEKDEKFIQNVKKNRKEKSTWETKL